jgi:hypothetical protein
MPTEQFSNNAPTNQMATGYTATATQIGVASISGWPTIPQFRLLNPRTGEVFLVTGISGTVLTVVRGAEGTSPQPILGSDVLTHILTAGALYNIGNTLRIVGTPPSITLDFFSQQSPGSYPPASDSLVIARSIETRPGMPQYGNSAEGFYSAMYSPSWSPPAWGGIQGYPAVTNFTVQYRARFTVPTGFGGSWNFYYNSDDGCEVTIWADPAWTTQVGATIGSLQYSGTSNGNNNITLAAGATYYYRARWGQGSGNYLCVLAYTPPGGTQRQLLDDQIISGTPLYCPFRAIGGINVVGNTCSGDLIQLFTAGGALQAWNRVQANGADAPLFLPSGSFVGSVRLTDSDGVVVNTLNATFNGGEFIRVGVRN